MPGNAFQVRNCSKTALGSAELGCWQPQMQAQTPTLQLFSLQRLQTEQVKSWSLCLHLRTEQLKSSLCMG